MSRKQNPKPKPKKRLKRGAIKPRFDEVRFQLAKLMKDHKLTICGIAFDVETGKVDSSPIPKQQLVHVYPADYSILCNFAFGLLPVEPVAIWAIVAGFLKATHKLKKVTITKACGNTRKVAAKVTTGGVVSFDTGKGNKTFGAKA